MQKREGGRGFIDLCSGMTPRSTGRGLLKGARTPWQLTYRLSMACLTCSFLNHGQDGPLLVNLKPPNCDG